MSPRPPRPGRSSPAAPSRRKMLGNLAPARAVEVIAPSVVAAGRMILRPLRESDRSAFLAAINADRVHLERWIPLNAPGETDDEFFDRQLALARAGDAQGNAWRRVAVLPDGRIVGGFNLNAITRGLQCSADANWWIAAPFTRQGYASEGVRTMLRHAFDDLPKGLGLATVHAGISPDNVPSVRLAHALGFHHDPGVQSYLRIGERWELHDIYACTALEPSALAG